MDNHAPPAGLCYPPGSLLAADNRRYGAKSAYKNTSVFFKTHPIYFKTEKKDCFNCEKMASSGDDLFRLITQPVILFFPHFSDDGFFAAESL
jgi:hypothetical protein